MRVPTFTLSLFACLLFVPATFAQDMPLTLVLLPGEDWVQLADGFKYTEGPAADDAGNVFFTDVPNSKIYRLDVDNKLSTFAEETGGANGLMFGPGGKLYACAGKDKKIVAYDRTGRPTTIADKIAGNDLVVTREGNLYVSAPLADRLWYIPAKGDPVVVAEGLKPNGLILWPTQGTLVVADIDNPWLWTYKIATSGKLENPERYYSPLRQIPWTAKPGSDGMTVDRDGRVYVATAAGLQVYDPTGRPSGVILKPQPAKLSNVCFGGPDLSYLYATSTDKVYRRKTKTTGVLFFQPATEKKP